MKDEILEELPLFKAVKDYIDEDIAPFAMPGHKNGRAFCGEGFDKFLLKADMTEVDGVDNLHKPEGVIKKSEEMLTKLYRSRASYFLVNGSTSGNMIMIFATFDEGDKIIVERNCHRSIMNAIILRKLKPVFVKNIIDENFKAPVGIDINHLENVMDNNKDAKGIVLTYPYYYGVGIGVKKVIDMCKNVGLTILVDSAHGAHFGFNDKLPKSIQELGADISVMSAHKTLPSLTQTAYIHVNKKELVDKVNFYKGLFLSTSPSYMFMISLEYGRYFLEENASAEYDILLDRINNLKKNIDSLDYVKIIDKNFFVDYKQDIELDESRIVLHVKKGLSAHKFLDYLRENKVQAEMSDERNVILIPSPFNNQRDFEILENALLACDSNILKSKEKNFYDYDLPEAVFTPEEVINMKSEYINILDSQGKIAAENIIPYPPGVPLVVMGEKIESRHIDIIEKCIKDNVTIIGLHNNKIVVIVE